MQPSTLVATVLAALTIAQLSAGCAVDEVGPGSTSTTTTGGVGGGCHDGSSGAGIIAPTCGGPCAPCELGAACSSAEACASGACVDGVCCETACSGACVACVKSKTAAPDGTCAPITADTDPDAECLPSAATTCGSSGDGCNGDAAAPGCRLHASGTECASASCVDGTALPASECDGQGTCQGALPISCSPGVCDPSGVACLGSCAKSEDCVATHFCKDGECLPQAPLGAVCSAVGECASGSCADGVCCDTACAGGCEACSTTLGASQDGSCTVLTKGNPGAPTCGPYVCDGKGAACPVSCLSGADCAAPAQCLNAACVVLQANGASCKGDVECLSGKCVDGTCCNKSCTTACMACDVKGQEGSCAFVPPKTDPDGECLGHCDGAGACEGPTYLADIQPLFEAKCGLCHTVFKSGGTNFASVYQDALLPAKSCAGLDVAACTVVRLANGSMPKNKGCTGDPKLDVDNVDCFTAANHAELAAWLMAGRPQ